MIYIAEYEGYENNEHKLEITGKTVSKEEYDDFMANFKFYGQYHQFKEIHEICLESNLDLMDHMVNCFRRSSAEWPQKYS